MQWRRGPGGREGGGGGDMRGQRRVEARAPVTAEVVPARREACAGMAGGVEDGWRAMAA